MIKATANSMRKKPFPRYTSQKTQNARKSICSSRAICRLNLHMLHCTGNSRMSYYCRRMASVSREYFKLASIHLYYTCEQFETNCGSIPGSFLQHSRTLLALKRLTFSDQKRLTYKPLLFMHVCTNF